MAHEIVGQLDRSNAIWRKWDGRREELAKSALGCWVPIADLRDFLNDVPGPTLTKTDVVERMQALEEEHPWMSSNEALQTSCLTLYEHEKRDGTELPAIIRALRSHVDREEDRLSAEQQQRYERAREEGRIVREQRLLSGGDCSWTQLQNSQHWCCRVNARTYRLSPTTDKKWELHRVTSISDAEKGRYIGRYQRRGYATKVVREVAYHPEPRW